MDSRLFPSTRLRRPLAALVATACLAGPGAGSALAQDSLPDPNKPDGKSAAKAPKKAGAEAGAKSSDLPTTGIEASWLVLSGVALLAAGVAVKPAARMRRSYRTDAWEQAVRAGS